MADDTETQPASIDVGEILRTHNEAASISRAQDADPTKPLWPQFCDAQEAEEATGRPRDLDWETFRSAAAERAPQDPAGHQAQVERLHQQHVAAAVDIAHDQAEDEANEREALLDTHENDQDEWDRYRAGLEAEYFEERDAAREAERAGLYVGEADPHGAGNFEEAGQAVARFTQEHPGADTDNLQAWDSGHAAVYDDSWVDAVEAGL